MAESVPPSKCSYTVYCIQQAELHTVQTLLYLSSIPGDCCHPAKPDIQWMFGFFALDVEVVRKIHSV